MIYVRDLAKLSSDRIYDDYEIHHIRSNEKPRKLKYHFHDFHEVFILLKGNVNVIVEGREYDIQPGNVFLFHSQDLHRAIINESGIYERCYIYVNPLYLEDISTKLTKLDLCFMDGKSNLISTKINDVSPYISKFDSYSTNDFYGNDLKRTLLFLDLMMQLNLFLLKQDNDLIFNRIIENSLVSNVIDYIQQNLNKNLKVDIIAKHFYVSRTHLYREFKKITGFTIHDYILMKRLIYSKKLLLQKNKAIDIYCECGFTNYQHFMKCFKKQFGITPKEFQNKNSIIHRSNSFKI